jgi:hypothetical protein
MLVWNKEAWEKNMRSTRRAIEFFAFRFTGYYYYGKAFSGLAENAKA